MIITYIPIFYGQQRFKIVFFLTGNYKRRVKREVKKEDEKEKERSLELERILHYINFILKKFETFTKTFHYVFHANTI